MNDLFVLPKTIVAARNQAQQLKVIMNLPVRLVSDNQVLDVMPLTADPTYVPKRARKNLGNIDVTFPTLNELTRFFHSCRENDLLTRKEVAAIYQISTRTLNEWYKSGLIARHRLAPGLVVYKRKELPTIEQIYGPY